jgi:hypothetical protein
MSGKPYQTRILYGILILSTFVGSWLGMQALHELGHVAGARLTGGRVTRVVLHPLTISRTDLADNPQPAVVAWAGPLLGAVLPLVIWGLAAGLRMPGAFVFRFFAGFCLIANGAYLAAGALTGIGDAGQLLQHGVPAWSLWLFAAPTVVAGLALWHRQGRHFGLGQGPDEVRPGVVCAAGIACSLLVILGLLLAGQLPRHDRRTPRQPAAEIVEQHAVASAADAVLPTSFVQGQREADRERVPAAIRVDDDALTLEPEVVNRCADDTGVCLVEDDRVPVVGGQPCMMQDVAGGADQHVEGPLDSEPASPVDELPPGSQDVRGDERATAARRLTEPAVRATSGAPRVRHNKGLLGRVRIPQRRAAAVAKQRTCPLVRRIHRVGHR